MANALEVVSSNVPAIPYPSRARDRAIDAIVAYLRMLKKWAETKLALAGDGSGNVDVSGRTNFIYVRPQDEDGEVAEARNILLLTIPEGDTVLLARERPGGLGGWLVVEWLGAGSPDVVTCDSLFWINLDSWAIYRVDSVSAAASSGTLVNTDLNASGYSLLWLASGGANKVSALLTDGNNALGTSNDGGVNFSVANQPDNNNYWFAYWRTMEADLLDADYLWAVLPSYYDPYPSGGSYSVLYWSYDGGTTWARNEIIIYAVGNESGGEIVASRHDGASAFVIATEMVAAAPPTTITDVYAWVVGDVPEAGVYEFTPAQIAMLPSVNGMPFWGCTRYGDTDNFYFLPYYEMRLFRFTWSTKTLTDLGLVNGLSGGNYQKQIVSTRNGTLLIPASPFGGTPFLYVYRSTDGGVSWTQIDLTALVPTARAQDTWDYIAIGKNDTLVIPIQGDASDGYDGYLLFSTDDGATWQRTNVFIPMAYYGRPIDICGEGL